jgi:hypothetical protein
MKAGQRHSHTAFGLIATTEELSIYLCVLSEKAVNLLVKFAGENIEQFQSKEGRKEDYTSLQPPRADWMDWQHPNNQNNPSQNVQHQQCPSRIMEQHGGS